MKKIFLQRLAISLTTLMLTSYLPAQTAITTPPFRVADVSSHSALMAELKAKDAKSFDHFTNAYPTAILQHIRQEKDGKHINATINGNTLRVHYNVNGKFLNATLSYPASELSEKIADEVMESFPGYTVFGNVIDIKVGDKSALLVLIENRKSWKRVRVTNDAMDVYEEYAKSK